MDSVETEATALLQEVLTMLQQGLVPQRSCSLPVQSQAELAGFNSQTTRVIYHSRSQVHTNGYHSQDMVNTTTSIVTFSISSPDVFLLYDHLKLRLEEYCTLLAFALDTLKLPVENDKTVIILNRAKELEELMEQT